MKISLNWIKDYVALPADMDLMQLSYDLTMSTVEVEGTEDLSKRFDNMVVGVITEVLPHPNADSLKISKRSSAAVSMSAKVSTYWWHSPVPSSAGTVRATPWRSRRPSSAVWRATV